MFSKCHDVVHDGCWFLSEGQTIVYILRIYMNILVLGVRMNAGIPRNQLSSIILRSR